MSQRLPWFPCDAAYFLAEMAALDDEQRGWYFTLLLLCWVSLTPGYLRAHALWKLAGARTELFFERKKAAVMACFEFCDSGGEKYLYHPYLLRVLAEQQPKLRKGRFSSGSTGPPEKQAGEQLSLSLLSVLSTRKKPEARSVRAGRGENDGNERKPVGRDGFDEIYERQRDRLARGRTR